MLALDHTVGALFIGAIVTSALYGLTTLQTYFYFLYYPKDTSGVKALVSVIWILDTLHVALMTHSVYYYLVTNYSNQSAIAVGHWSLFVSIALNVMIAFLVQCFFTKRIFQLSSMRLRWWITSITFVMVLGHFCFGMETVVFCFIKREFRRLPEVNSFAATPFAIVTVLSDIFIAAALCILLHGNRTSFRKTNSLITSLITYAINRCVLTSVIAIVEVVVFSLAPHSLWWLGIDFIVGKLYANSLLATLNSRQSLRDQGTIVNSVPVSDISFQEKTYRDMNKPGPEISITTDVETNATLA